ncbi:MAG: hypothetical protein IJU26_08740 [Synergistaceae bacterium]|nr:hypothetical protein [Synergistaceae bacterium]
MCEQVNADDGHEVIDRENSTDFCGKSIDQNFAEYVAERCRLSVRDSSIASEIRRINVWREVKIFRYELESLIHFAARGNTLRMEREDS